MWVSLWVFYHDACFTSAPQSTGVENAVRLFLKGGGYDVHCPTEGESYTSVLAQLQRGDIPPPSCVIMDLNYGHAGSEDVAPAEAFYAFCVPNKIKFLGLSGHPSAVFLAQEKGIPSALKGCGKVFDSLERLIE